MELVVLFVWLRLRLGYTMVFVHYAWMLGVIVLAMFSIRGAILESGLRGDTSKLNEVILSLRQCECLKAWAEDIVK